MRANIQARLTNTQGWIVCMSAALFFFYEFMQMHLFSSISGELMRDLQLNAMSLSYLSSAFLIANTLFLMPAGLILDRASTRLIIILALLACIIGTLTFAFTDNYWVAMFGRFLAGIGNAFCFLSCMLLITRWFPANQRSLVTGIVVTFAMLGGIVAQTPFRFLSDALGWRQTILIDGLIGLAFLVVIARNVIDSPDSNQPQSDEADPEKSFMTSLKLSIQNTRNLLYGLYAALMNLPIVLLGAIWGSLYLNQVHHLNMTHASLATSMIFLGMIFGAPLFGAWSDTLNSKRLPMIIGAVVSMMSITVILLTHELSEPQALVWFFMLGFFSATQVLVYPQITQINPRAVCATALGVASTIIMGVAAIAQPLFGYLMQNHWHRHIEHNIPIYQPENYTHAMLMIPIAFIIALAIVTWLNENHRLIRE